MTSTENMGAERAAGAAPTAPVLEVRNASKMFGPVKALNGVNLRLEQGEVLGLLGDNGAWQVHAHQSDHRRAHHR
ncbi:hypothetical protein [Nesterenkonia pannonica]|uniref:hypothetical protein n=1 Tax=Nesterenkonia pannonica TaxID=1548602 RepID=UPI0021643120|nr:hypothetical protein [Nesterenkonia pannonica]